MIRVTTAGKSFTGSCKHKIDKGRRLIIIERPHFLCNKCGKADVAKIFSLLKEQLQ